MKNDVSVLILNMEYYICVSVLNLNTYLICLPRIDPFINTFINTWIKQKNSAECGFEAHRDLKSSISTPGELRTHTQLSCLIFKHLTAVFRLLDRAVVVIAPIDTTCYYIV